jgi:hypothetical protein
MNIIDCVVFVQIAKKRAVFGHKKRKGDTSSDFQDVVAAMFIWIHGVQKFVLFVLGDVLGLLPKFSCVCRLVAPTTEVAPRASQASREGGVVWQAGKT